MSNVVEVSHHQHGKSRVRVGRVWRVGNVHHFVEWNINIVLFSGCLEAYTSGDNNRVVATDTMKNTVYAVAKQCTQKLSAEDFGVQLARHFLNSYPKIVTGVSISIVEKPWTRVVSEGIEHNHGYKLGMEKHTAEVTLLKDGSLTVKGGLQEMSVLKTTQSGFTNFVRDQYTSLPEVTERMLATSITAVWTFSGKPRCYNAVYEGVKKVLADAFYGPPQMGVYSPSVQTTLHHMGRAVLERYPEIRAINLNMPNLHFLPFNNPTIGFKFEDDVYTPVDEPHGSIEATVTRTAVGLSSRL